MIEKIEHEEEDIPANLAANMDLLSKTLERYQELTKTKGWEILYRTQREEVVHARTRASVAIMDFVGKLNGPGDEVTEEVMVLILNVIEALRACEAKNTVFQTELINPISDACELHRRLVQAGRSAIAEKAERFSPGNPNPTAAVDAVLADRPLYRWNGVTGHVESMPAGDIKWG